MTGEDRGNKISTDVHSKMTTDTEQREIELCVSSLVEDKRRAHAGIPSDWVKSNYSMEVERQGVNKPSVSPTSSDILDLLEPAQKSTCLLRIGRCWRGDPLSNTGKRQQIVQILSLTLLPILGLWAFTVYSVSDSIKGKTNLEHTQNAVKFSVELGILLDRIQRERDMSMLYLSILGPATKTFLMNEYLLTDEALMQLSTWPVNDEFGEFFKSKYTFQKHLNEHRNEQNPNNFDIYIEMNFYNLLIERFVVWMYGAITESSIASIWKVLVAYQKIVSGMEHIGIERALGTIFYVDGGLGQTLYERYIERVNIFKANYRSAVLYSNIVDPIFQDSVTSNGTNLTVVIERFRSEIQHSILDRASIIKGQWWFDNMTIYLDRLLLIQQDLASFINSELQSIIDQEEKNLTVSVCFLALVILMCPLVIYSVEVLTSSIQIYAIAMVQKTKELVKEQRRADALLYQMVPQPIASKMKRSQDVEAKYFKSVTIMFCNVCDFTQLLKTYPPTNAIGLLQDVFNNVDEVMSGFDVFKVENIRDAYMIASGVPNRSSQNASVMANLALALTEMMKQTEFKAADTATKLQLRIGMHTGRIVAGTVSLMPPRYCLVGHTITIAEHLKATGEPNCIHISDRTQHLLHKDGTYVMTYRHTIQFNLHEAKETEMKTFWLVGMKSKGASASTSTEREKQAVMKSPEGKEDHVTNEGEASQRTSGDDPNMACPAAADDDRTGGAHGSDVTTAKDSISVPHYL